MKHLLEEYGIEPINIIDLKALMGDASDNIPGVKGIGEKTALKLLQEYKTIDNLYNNIEKVKGRLKDKLLMDEDNARFSYQLAIIEKNVPLDININDVVYKGADYKKLNAIYEELEFYSFLKKQQEVIAKPKEVQIVKNIDEIDIKDNCAVYLEILGNNYHISKILGLAVYNNDNSLFIPLEVLKQNPKFLKDNIKYTYDYKKLNVAFKWNNIDLDNVCFDTMIAAYLLDMNAKEDISYLANTYKYDIPFYENMYGKTKLKEPDINTIAYTALQKAKFIYETYEKFKEKLTENKLDNIFYNIEMPLSKVLAKMEYTGIKVDTVALEEMGKELNVKIDLITRTIYNQAGCEFNISSPKQLGDILFNKLGLKANKKLSTSIEVLNKLKDSHPIINSIIEYRMLTKLMSTYVDGLKSYILKDGKVHTIFTQTLTRTGRLSSIEPNLQNIPIRYEEGKLVRKVFVPSNDSVILSGDYSQIELRILAHMANVESLIEAFKNNIDIHSKTASDIFKVDLDLVTKEQRRMAKAVNFGIIYGISQYGLAENTGLSNSEAKKFIEDYLNLYPGIKGYMDRTIKDAYEDNIIKTMFGRMRKIEELDSKNYMIRQQGERIALNTPIQGTSADIIKMAMIEVDKMITTKNLKTKMLIQVHDELVFDVPNDEIDIFTKELTNIMENVVTLRVPLKIEVSYGNNWYQAK